jgi:hypothetical protein
LDFELKRGKVDKGVDEEIVDGSGLGGQEFKRF